MTFTQLTKALRRGNFIFRGEVREWQARRGKSTVRLAVHMERDMVGMFLDLDGEPPATTGRILSFGEAADVAGMDVAALEARIKAEAERRAVEAARRGLVLTGETP